MSQGQVQIQKTEQKQVQTVSQQQLLQAMLTELPVNQLIDRINTEMDDNPALELSSNEDVDEMDNSAYDSSDDASDTFGDASDAIGDTPDDYESRSEKEDRQTALDDALSSIGRDDEDLPVYQGGQRDVEYGSTQSFYDQLIEQMNETGYHYFDWNVSCGDGADHTADELVGYTIGEADGCHSCCVLMHDSAAKDTTVEALPRIIQYFIDNGLEFDVLLSDTFGYHF